MQHYDVIVLGTGGVGSAAAAHLARRGERVLGLDRFPGGHAHGSSHGETRIIRQAYFEHADYVPLLRRAYVLWRELEQRASEQLYHPVGLLEIGPPDGVVIPGILAAAAQHQLPLDHLSPEVLAQRFPGFVLPAGYQTLFERDAGFLMVERCVLAHLADARRAGAELRHGECIESWEADREGVRVRTSQASYTARRLVITAGAWAGQLLADLGLRLRVLRKHLHWFANETPSYRADQGGPCFFYETPEGYFYGFPQINELGVKVAEHSGGSEVLNPLADDKSAETRDRERVTAFMRQHLPGVSGPPRRHEVCYYTMSPDENFIVDRHPRHANVVFAAGLSGHGFKFTSVLGEILADLSQHGQSPLPLDFLRLARLAQGAGH